MQLPLAFALAALLAAGGAFAARGQQVSRQLSFDDLFSPENRARQPSRLSWAPDGESLVYRWGDDEDSEGIWLLDPASNERREVLSASDLEALPVDDLRWGADSRQLLLVSQGDLYLLDLEGEEEGEKAGAKEGKTTAAPRRVTETPEDEEDPKISPDGTQVAFVRGDDLYVLDLASGKERALTHDGGEETVLNGKTDWVYWEELWGRSSTGFWWSTDSRRIAFYRFDESEVATYPVVNFMPTYPEVEMQRYPKAGTANPRVKVGVVELAQGEVTWLDTGEDPTTYLPRVFWRPSGQGLVVLRLNRDQNHLDALLCQPEGGSCRVLASQENATWVNLNDDFAFLSDDRFVWGSEESGWRQLYLYGADGKRLRQLTTGAGAVTSLEAVDAPKGWLVYSAFGGGDLGAAQRQVYRQQVDGGEAQALGSTGGWNDARVAPKTGFFVHSFSRANDPGSAVVRRADGSQAATLPSTPAPGYDPETLPQWEMLTLDGPDGLRLPARLLKPPNMEEGRRYPAIMYHYGCPASQVVMDRWEGRGRDLWHKMMAQRGYVVLQVDNGGSIFFGKKGEDKAYRRFGPGHLASQEAGVAFLKTLPYVDSQRIGLWGWSGGGSNTLYCLLNSPGTWRAGVAGAPVTDWRLYDSIWTERYLDTPEDNPEGYELSSPLTYAEKLEDALLIVHGTADDNVHPQNTLVMIQALVKAGKPFEDAIYPRQKHGFRGPHMRHFYERMTSFFDRELAEPAAPKVEGTMRLE